MKNRLPCIAIFCFIWLMANAHNAWGWHDETHLAVARAAGYYKWYNAAGPDITKIKAGSIEGDNHFYNNVEKQEITTATVLRQASRYNNPRDEDGHLYGAIIASLRHYKDTLEQGKYAEYHLAFCAHYIADLSQPFHNIPYDSFNKSRHVKNDGTVEKEVLKNVVRVKEKMYHIDLSENHFEKDLAREIARIANQARLFGYRLKKENRNMTKQEAYEQLAHSASLLKAVLSHFDKLK